MRVFIHTPYLVNLGSPTPATYEQSVATVAHNLRRAAEIGAEGVVVHTGSCVGPRAPSDAARCARSARACCRCSTLAAGDDAPWLLLEPTAGQGRSLCAGVEDLEPYLAALDRHPRGRHLPGHLPRVRRRRAARRARRHHRDRRPARRDRRRRAGCGWCTPTTRWTCAARSRTGTRRSATGYIGLGAFEELFAHPATAGVPFVLETPGSRDAGDPQIAAAPEAARRGDAEPATAVRPCSPPLALLAMTAMLGIDVLPDPRPARPGAGAGLPGGPVRDRQRRAARWSRPRAVGRLSPRVAPARGGARAAVRRRADPADRRAGAHAGQRVRLHHRHVRRRHARCSPRCCCAPGSPGSPGPPSRSRWPGWPC